MSDAMNGLFDGLHVYVTEFTALNNSGVHGWWRVLCGNSLVGWSPAG